MKAKFPLGKQRDFIKKVLEILGCPNLKELINRGVDVNYNSLKNYYCERRVITLNLVENLCNLSKLEKKDLVFEILDNNWGQVKGGKRTRLKN
ncbi:hypothetical protein GW931_01325 [archaeon]|nr:hypothetical protein [archaeon]PJC45235.1 MAG: hypothetical protein CO037_02565 [Candidatus Pacearchaeota archaeon CG_4_9_14_0_2_um_filter_30_8]